MQIKFYTSFQKRVNSTKRPDDSVNTPVVITGHIKQPCDVVKPVIEFQSISEQQTPSVYIYAHIPIFGKYYFVSRWAFEAGLWVVYLNEDVLATYRTNIGNTSAYIERASASANGDQSFYDPNVIDREYPTKTSYDMRTLFIQTPWTISDIDDGTYVLGVITRIVTGSVGGGVQYYALTYDQIKALCNYLMNNQFFSDAGFNGTFVADQQITQDVAKCLLNPFQYIVSCMWFPFDVTDIIAGTPQLDSITVGPWTTIGYGYPMFDNVGFRERFNFELPVHPQADSRGFYLNYSPYSEFMCYLSPFGSFPIDPVWADNLSTRTISGEMTVDCVTGQATLQLFHHQSGSDRNVFFTTSTQIGVPIQLAQVDRDYIKTATSLVQAGAGVMNSMISGFAGNATGAIYGGVMAVNSVGDAVKSAMPQAITSGSNGSFLGLISHCTPLHCIISKFTLLVDEDLTEVGRPLCKVRTINTLSGFIKCAEVTIDYPAYDIEKEQIHSQLLKGFFWE